MKNNSNNDRWVVSVDLPMPSLKDNTADVDRLVRTLEQKLEITGITADLELMRVIPDMLRRWGYSARCVLFSDGVHTTLTGLLDPAPDDIAMGLAVDLGTTRIVTRLIDLESAKTAGETSFENPQTAIGDDILTRIHHASSTEGLEQLHGMIIGGLNNAIRDLCAQAGTDSKNIHAIAVAGNTTMTHLLLKLPPGWIIREPYIPAVNRPGMVKAEALGINANPMARVFLFPNVGSYFGGDLVSGILFSGMHRLKDTAILVDVGTNAEVVLGNRDWLVACAGAAGPALEGGVAQIGSKAGPGVIDTIFIDPKTKKINFDTIGHKPPLGICGSALLDLIAQLFLNGFIDIRGKLVPEKLREKFEQTDGIPQMVVVPAEQSGTGMPLRLTQPDIDNIIRSKAAMYTILDTITSSVGLGMDDITTFFVAGTFGSMINPKSAISIGMLPDLPLTRFKVLGNSSLEGASLMLSSRAPSKEIGSIQSRITYLELNVNQEFMNRFSAAKFLPHTDRSLFPSVPVPEQ
ncbi:MAG: [Fe-S]-binding protein [Desulfococcus sp. 4484_241]|nr:MAG: [Fe-S]-binding protein [Desulfococcus sp. 4484_241]